MRDTWAEIEIVARRYKLLRAFVSGCMVASKRTANTQENKEWHIHLAAKSKELEEQVEQLEKTAGLAKDYFRNESNLALSDLGNFLKTENVDVESRSTNEH